MKNGYFEIEQTLNLDVTYKYTDKFGEIEVENLRIELGNGKNIDLFSYLPTKVIDEICEQIIEDIEDDKKWS